MIPGRTPPSFHGHLYSRTRDGIPLPLRLPAPADGVCDMAGSGTTISGPRLGDCPLPDNADPSADPCAPPPGGFLSLVDSMDYGDDDWNAADLSQYQCCIRFTVPHATSQFILLSRLAEPGTANPLSGLFSIDVLNVRKWEGGAHPPTTPCTYPTPCAAA